MEVAPYDFESYASASSATRPNENSIFGYFYYIFKIVDCQLIIDKSY